MASTGIHSERLAVIDDIAFSRWQANIRRNTEPTSGENEPLGKRETTPAYVRFIPPYLLDPEPQASIESEGEE